MNVTNISKLFLILGVLLVSGANGANILFIANSITDSVVLHAGRLADLLVQNGHNVTFFNPVMVRINQKKGTTLAHNIRLEGFSDVILNYFIEYGKNIMEPYDGWFRRSDVVFDADNDFCKEILDRRAELMFLKQTEWDLIVTNDYSFCFTGLAHWIGAKAHVWLVTGPLQEYMTFATGIPAPPSYVPVMEDLAIGTEMNFMERVTNLRHFLHVYYMYNKMCHTLTHTFHKEVDPMFPNVCELGRKVSAIFVNDNEFISFPRPIIHKTIYIGGAGQAALKPLDERFSKILQKGKEGVVFVSFGTAVRLSAMKREKMLDMVRVFEGFSHLHFVWKVNKEDMELEEVTESIPNIELVHWAPQQDLLAHPRVKAFVSHGGVNSIMEAAMRGVPTVVMPIFFDQFRNAKIAEHREFAVFLPKETLSESTLRAALSKVLNDPKYRQAANRMKSLMENQPNQPDETFLKWVNFIVAHGGLPELHIYGATLSAFVYLNIDILLVALGLLAVIIFIIYKLATSLIGRIAPKTRPTSKKTKQS